MSTFRSNTIEDLSHAESFDSLAPPQSETSEESFYEKIGKMALIYGFEKPLTLLTVIMIPQLSSI